MKKRIAVVAIAALMAGCLTNVGTVSAAEPTEITFWHYMSEDKEGKFVNEAIEEFNNSQDEVHVTGTVSSKRRTDETVHHRCSFRRTSRLWNGR